METPDPDRLTLLERAQLLHDATLRRHGQMLDRHEERMGAHEMRMAAHELHMASLSRLAEQQTQNLIRLTDIATRLEPTLQAIKDMLDRGNGRP